jgi:hypothetical protein
VVIVAQWLEGAGEHVKRLLEGTLGGRWVAVDNHAAVADGAVALRAAVGEAAAAAAAANADLPYTTANLKVRLWCPRSAHRLDSPRLIRGGITNASSMYPTDCPVCCEGRSLRCSRFSKP